MPLTLFKLLIKIVLDCLLNPDHEPTIEVVWNKSEPSFIYVISETGTTSFWEFLKPSHEWIKHKSFQLSNAKGIRIVDVKLHEESRNIVWCERRGLNDEAFCVCCRNIIGNYNEKAKGELGTTQAILHNCPPINIFCFNGGVCIHPCQLYLEKVYVFWTGKKDVEVINQLHLYFRYNLSGVYRKQGPLIHGSLVNFLRLDV